jgi:hypothetical protein
MPDAVLPHCHALIASADDNWRESLCQRLRDAEQQDEEEHPCCDLTFTGVALRDALLKRVAEDGELQCVVLDAVGTRDSLALLKQIHALRSELDVFLAVPAGESVKDDRAELLDREDTRASVLLRRLRSAIARRARTPFADTLREYVEGARDAWHTPGHSSGDGLRESPWVADFYRMMGEHVFNADLSVSVQELDSLLDPARPAGGAGPGGPVAFGARAPSS